MHTRTSIIVAVFLLAGISAPIAAQGLPPGMQFPSDATGAFVLWPDGPPGTAVTGAPELIMPFPPDPSLTVVRNVEVPTLTAFIPAPGQGNGTAVIIAPGGVGISLGIDAEGYHVARWLRDRGVAAFVLRYRLPRTPRDDAAFLAEMRRATRPTPSDDSITRSGKPLVNAGWEGPASEDARQAIRVVRSDASRWRIDPQKIGIVGFSAGGMVSIASAIEYDAGSRPDFVVPVYGVHPKDMRVPPDAPPMFLAFAVDDPSMDGEPFDPLAVFAAWRGAGRPVELHVYERGGHGFAVKSLGTTSDAWTSAWFRWMRSHDLLPK